MQINRIKVALAEQNRTNKWLAAQLNKSDITASRWARNKNQPSIEQLVEIARALNTTPKELLNDINPLV